MTGSNVHGVSHVLALICKCAEENDGTELMGMRKIKRKTMLKAEPGIKVLLGMQTSWKSRMSKLMRLKISRNAGAMIWSYKDQQKAFPC